MQCIPKSRIKKKNDEIFQAISKLILPNEINQYIISFLPKTLDVNDNENIFWTELGIETCNLDKWSWYCFNILQQSFGKTYTKSIRDLHGNLFIHLRGYLDSLICWNYPGNIHNIKSISGDNIDITHVFYNSNIIEEYDITYRYRFGGKLAKTISSRDKQYIATFIERMNIYLEYLETNINKFPVNNVYNISKQTRKLKINTILKTINKMKKIIDKMTSIIVNITTND